MRVSSKVVDYTRLALTSELLSGSFLVFLGGNFSSFLAFILNIFLARSLSYSDYGIYVSLLSLFSLAIIPGNSLGAVVVRFATNFHSIEDTDNFSAFYKKSFQALAAVGILLIILSIIFAGFASRFLHISDHYLIIFVAILVFANYILTLNISYINSILKFKELSKSYVISGIVKIISGVVLVWLGFKVYGALSAILLLILIQTLYLFLPLRKHINFNVKNIKLPIFDIFRYAFPTSIAVLALYSFVSSDVILVKHFFPAYEAGLYGGLSLVGKVIFYFTLPIPAVLFPLVVKRKARNEDHSRLLYLSLVVVSLASILITIFYYISPTFILKLFLGGQDYLKTASLLGMYGIFLTIYTLNNVLVTYFLSLRKTAICSLVFIFAVLQIILIFNFHNDFKQIIEISLWTSVLLLASLVLYYLKDKPAARFNLHWQKDV